MDKFLSGLFFGVLLGAIVLMIVLHISGLTSTQFQAAAVKHNVAEYNSQTGNWQWKDCK